MNIVDILVIGVGLSYEKDGYKEGSCLFALLWSISGTDASYRLFAWKRI